MNTQNIKRIKWLTEEDCILTECVAIFGTNKWKKAKKKIEESFPEFDKSAKQCRERWHNYLDPKIQKEKWSDEEISLLIYWHRKYGSRWSLIGEHLAGRTDNSIKNAFYCMMRKMIRRVAKYSVCADQYSTQQSLDHSLYILNCINEYYIKPLEMTLAVPGDQYIVSIIKKYSISKDRIESYTKKMASSAQYPLRSDALNDYAILKKKHVLDGCNMSSTDDSQSVCSLSKLSENRTLPSINFGACPLIIESSSKQAFCFTPYILKMC